jgi:endonuclease/exonuclease/phosphatase family metal-dependent hydrolase
MKRLIDSCPANEPASEDCRLSAVGFRPEKPRLPESRKQTADSPLRLIVGAGLDRTGQVGWNVRCVLLLLACWAAGSANLASSQVVNDLRVMSYNIWVGGTVGGQPLSRTAGVIQTAQADVVGIQEVGGSAASLASTLGFHYVGFNSDLAILSRYPIVETIGGFGARIQVSPQQDVYLFDVHLAAYPYQPYDLRDGLISTEAQAVAQAQSTRGGALNSYLNAVQSSVATGKPVFFVGDFNEPSHLDWTQEAATAGLHFGKKVAWPASTAMAGAGFVDAYRELRPDEIARRGDTWTPGYPAPNMDSNEVQDRIDFVYYQGAAYAKSVSVLGYTLADGVTDVAIQPYPSDHRSVVVNFDIDDIQGDLNDDNAVDAADWMIFRTWQHADLSALTVMQARAKGDLNHDLRNDHDDFVIFKQSFEAANGPGAFAALLQVPEPAGPALATVAALALTSQRRRTRQFSRLKAAISPASTARDTSASAARWLRRRSRFAP